MIKRDLTWPTAAQTIQTDTESVVDSIDSAMSDALAKLTAIESEGGYSRHPLSTEAESLLMLRAELESLLIQGQVLTVSPYQFQVGASYDSGQYLNPQTAIDVLTAKLRDQVDKNRQTGMVYCIVIMVSESTLSTFYSALSSLTTVLPLPDWCQVKRQVNGLLTHSVDKLYRPADIIQPRLKPNAYLNANPLRAVLTQQGAQLASLESLANDRVNVIGKLQALASKRANKLKDISETINALKTLTGSIWSAELNGTPESVASQLTLLTMPNNHQHTVASLLISAKPHTFFKELLC